jgi:hypothetical protein
MITVSFLGAVQRLATRFATGDVVRGVHTNITPVVFIKASCERHHKPTTSVGAIPQTAISGRWKPQGMITAEHAPLTHATLVCVTSGMSWSTR